MPSNRADVDAVAHKIAIALLNDIAEMYADPEVDPPLRRQARIALQHAILHLNGAAHSFDYAAKLYKGSVAGTFDYAPVIHRDSRIYQIAPERPKPRQRTIFVGPGEPTVADYIRRQNCRDFPCLGHAGRPPGKAGSLEVYGSAAWVSIAVPTSAMGHQRKAAEIFSMSASAS
jgi:hypothetical protein